MRNHSQILSKATQQIVIGLAFFVSLLHSSTAHASFSNMDIGALGVIILLSPVLIPLFLIALLIDVRFSRGVFLFSTARFCPSIEEDLPENKNHKLIDAEDEPNIKKTTLAKLLGPVTSGLKLFFTPVNKLGRRNHHLNTKTLLLAQVIGPITSVLTYYSLKVFGPVFTPMLRPIFMFLEPLPTLALPLLPILTKIGLLLGIAFLWTKFGKISKPMHKEIPIISVEQLKSAQEPKTDDET